ncbi:MAG TPA: helix-hairpin-helix domain-containing protein [Candidatus Binatia bacterium]|nr:helix-hairpin-helix domain-containing protein [Candidatus Binatia bacterium]
MARRVMLGMALATLVAVPACGFIHRHREPTPPKAIDLNHASLRKIEQLPGITPSMARRIVDGRPYSTPDDLVDRGILTRRELDRILDSVVVPERGD